MSLKFHLKNFKNLTVGSPDIAHLVENNEVFINIIECNSDSITIEVSQIKFAKDNLIQFRFIVEIEQHSFDFVMTGKVIQLQIIDSNIENPQNEFSIASEKSSKPQKTDHTFSRIELKLTQFNKKEWQNYLSLMEKKQEDINNKLLQMRGLK